MATTTEIQNKDCTASGFVYKFCQRLTATQFIVTARWKCYKSVRYLSVNSPAPKLFLLTLTLALTLTLTLILTLTLTLTLTLLLTLTLPLSLTLTVNSGASELTDKYQCY